LSLVYNIRDNFRGYIFIMSKIIKYFWDFVESVTFAGALFVFSYLFFFQVPEVQGSSSYPTLQTRERLILDKISYRFSDPKRGDFVIIYSPNDKNVDFVKRIIGLPEESIKISSCQVYINGELLEENYLESGTCTKGGRKISQNSEFLIPENKYVVMGDNRSGSSDSRDFGSIDRADIVGKIIWRIYPFDRIGSF